MTFNVMTNARTLRFHPHLAILRQVLDRDIRLDKLDVKNIVVDR